LKAPNAFDNPSVRSAAALIGVFRESA